MTPDLKSKIDAMSQIDMAKAWRFAPPGESEMFSGAAGEYFQKRFQELGGMTAEISKLIGWGR